MTLSIKCILLICMPHFAAGLVCSCDNTNIDDVSVFTKTLPLSVIKLRQTEDGGIEPVCGSNGATCQLRQTTQESKPICVQLIYARYLKPRRGYISYKGCGFTNETQQGCSNIPGGSLIQCICDNVDMCNEMAIESLPLPAEDLNSSSGNDGRDSGMATTSQPNTTAPPPSTIDEVDSNPTITPVRSTVATTVEIVAATNASILLEETTDSSAKLKSNAAVLVAGLWALYNYGMYDSKFW